MKTIRYALALDFVLPVIFAGIFIVSGLRLLFHARRINEGYATIHERRGRRGLAAYARSGVQRFTTRLVGLVCIVAPSALLIAMIWHRMH